MKIVIAPDSFKGSLTSVEVAHYVEKGIKMADAQIEVIKIPVADGGEGTVEALVAATAGRIIRTKVHGPLMECTEAFYGILGDGHTAVIEMAAAAGLNLVPASMRNPMHTTTYGVGELILAAMDQGCSKIIIGIGGSATNDGGMGMAQALGVRFYGKDSEILGQGGKYLGQVARIDRSNMDVRLAHTPIIVACDVKNPLYGPTGAAYVYGHQKGADPSSIQILDDGLRNYADQFLAAMGIDISNRPGSGAAGGLGGGLVAFLGAELKPGIEIIMEQTGFEEAVRDADLLITGEGRTDSQTAYGKVPVGLAGVAAKYGVPVVCLSGGLGQGFEALYKQGITMALSCISGPMLLEEAMEKAGEMLTQAAYGITRLMLQLEARYVNSEVGR